MLINNVEIVALSIDEMLAIRGGSWVIIDGELIWVDDDPPEEDCWEF